MLNKNTVSKSIVYIILILLSIVFLCPFLIMFFGSFNERTAGMMDMMFWWPDEFSINNYIANLRQNLITKWFLNSLIITVIPVITNAILCPLIGYIFAKKNFIGKKVVFTLFMMSIIVPGEITLIPNFIMFSRLNWVDTYLPFIVPGIWSVMFMFLSRQFISTIPNELIYAACIDGCGDARIFAQIILPLSKQIITTIIIFIFMGCWNNFMGPLIFTTSDKMYNLVVGLSSILKQNGDFGVQMAAGMINFIPIFIVFILGQKYFTKGVMISGIK